MIKVKVYIENQVDFLCDDVSVSFELPAIPREGERLFLTNELQAELENMARSSLEIASNYIEWFYRASCHLYKGEDDVQEINLKDLSFADASYVKSVVYMPNDDTVYIELGK